MRLVIVVISALCCALLAAPAWAGSGDAVIKDCAQHGRLQGHYTVAQLKDALANLPADLDEYSNCRQIISKAERQAAQNGGSSNGGSPSGGTSSGGGTPSGGGGTPPPAATGDTGGAGSVPPVYNGGGPNAPVSGGGGGGAPNAATGSGGSSSGGSGGANLAQQQAEANTAAQQGAPGRASLDLSSVTPASATASRTGVGTLPTPVIVALIVLVVAALAGMAFALRRRLPALAGLTRLRRVIPRRGA